VYMLWEEERLLYVGKAANLRVRLSQYRRSKRGEKAYSLVKALTRITFEVCESELKACLLEVEYIQSRKPSRNVAAKYSFLYPLVGIRKEGSSLWLCLTTLPAQVADYQFHGAFRSRETTATAFFALVRLLKYIGHPERAPKEIPSYTYLFGLRRLPETLVLELENLLLGESPLFLETLFHTLLEKPSARANAAEIKEDLRDLRTFWATEALPLRKAIILTGHETYPIGQQERDPLFLKASFTV
jgi:predicted GIY-YIG superfamily endonuclease